MKSFTIQRFVDEPNLSVHIRIGVNGNIYKEDTSFNLLIEGREPREILDALKGLHEAIGTLLEEGQPTALSWTQDQYRVFKRRVPVKLDLPKPPA